MVRNSSLHPANAEHLSLNSQCSPLSHPVEVNEYLIPLEIRPTQTTDRHLRDSSKRKKTEKKSTATVNLYSSFSRKENFCWSVVTWMLIRCPWSQLMLWECSSAICSVTSEHLGRRKVCSVLETALLRMPYATRILKHKKNPQEAQWKPVGFHPLKVKVWQVMCRDVDLPWTLL